MIFLDRNCCCFTIPGNAVDGFDIRINKRVQYDRSSVCTHGIIQYDIPKN